MWKSFSKGIEKNFKSATRGEYVDDGHTFDLKLRRDKVKREADGPAQTGRFKFTWVKSKENEKHSAEGSVEYGAGELLLRPDWWLHQMGVGNSDEKQVKYETNNSIEESKTGNGVYLVPSGFMDITCTRMDPGDNGLPTFKMELRAPETGKNSKTMEKTAVRGSSFECEIYLPLSGRGDEKEERSG